MASELAEAIRLLAQSKGISEDMVLNTIEESMKAAYKKKYGTDENCIIEFADDYSSAKMYARKLIVDIDEMEENDEDFDSVLHIDIQNALKLNPDSEIGDEMLEELDLSEFNRLAVQSAKQKTHQSFRDIQKDTLYAEYKDKVGEIIIGYFQRERNQTIYVDLGKVEGVLPRKMQSPRDSFMMNDRIKALIVDVKKTPTGLQIVLSRTDPEFVRKIVELEVPEVYDKTIEVRKIVREAGYRTKIAVTSSKEDVDPVGACVGLKGVRIQSIIRELDGEKIDILRYDDKPEAFIKNALTPAAVSHVAVLDSKTKMALAVVDDEQFSLAIGKQGMNVRLANRLTDWIIDVKTRSQYEEMSLDDSRRAADLLFGGDPGNEEPVRIADIDGISPGLAELLAENGIEYIEDYLNMSDDSRNGIAGLTEENKAQLQDLIAATVEIAEDETSAEIPDAAEDMEEEEEDVFECPECGARITTDMTACPSCGIGLSFEYEDEE